MTPAPPPGSRWTHVWIPLGAGLFVCALAASAFVVPELRPLHLFQALLYVAVVVLARRNRAMGFGAGSVIAVVWNGVQVFLSHLMQAGARELGAFLATGRLQRPDTLAVFVGGVGHVILLVGCIAAFRALRPRGREWRQFGLGAGLALAYFALIVATLRPR